MAKIIISGGGTGGHIFPAIAIADAIKALRPHSEILFVGAQGRMEMQRIPAAGYNIEGLPVAGIKRGGMLANISTAVKLVQSMRQAAKIIARYKPDAAIGVGGYASYPTLRAAQLKGIPTIIAEQNCYAGVANKHLARRAKRICTAFEGMETFFPKGKIILTGNPVRGGLQNIARLRSEAIDYFGLDKNKTTIAVLGGSLGAKTLNDSMMAHSGAIERCANVQWLWQTGSLYHEQCRSRLAVCGLERENVVVAPFIERMDYALAAADVVVSRSGAGAIAELAIAGKPCVLVPSPNVAQDHQTKNARSLQARNAALLVTDRAAVAMLVHTAIMLAADKDRCSELSRNISAMAKPSAAADIAQAALSLTKSE